MSDKGGEGLFHNLSRKELQILCKKHGLPARKSNSEMVESLHSYFQANLQKDLRCLSSSKSLGGLHETSILQPRMLSNWTENTIKDRCVLRSFPRKDKGNVNAKFNELESYMGHKACYKEAPQFQFISLSGGNNANLEDPLRNYSDSVVNGLQFHCRNITLGDGPQENPSISVKTSMKPPPSFEFYISSEEGIDLCVDLSSSPTDWIRKYNNQVYICENMGNTKSQSLHQELGCIGESNTQMKSSSLRGTVPVQIKDGQSQVEPFASLVMERTICGEIDHPDGENPKQDDEVFVTPMLQQCCHLGNNNVVCPRCSASHSVEIQFSEAGNFCKGAVSSSHKNGEFLDLVDLEYGMGTKQDTLANSSENDPCANHFSKFSEQQEWSNVNNGMDRSICSKVDYSLEKTCLKSGKRPIDNESENERDKPDAKVLRTAKHSAGGVLPRRSTRLVSK